MNKKTDTNPIKTAFDDALKKAGFHKKSGTWYLEKEGVILVANLQKSQWGQQYYINVAIWLKRIGKNKFPKENECHIRVRARSLSANDDELFDKALDLEEKTLTPEVRYEKIRSIMGGTVIPFLYRCGSVRGIKEEFQKGQLSNAMIRKQVKDIVLQT